jgi:hypothetical protein
MTARELERLRPTAYHEAGHAIASLVLGFPFEVVHINAKDEYLGMLEHEAEPVDNDPLNRLEDRIIRSFAGMAAEGHHLGRVGWRYGSRDFEFVFQVALVRHRHGTLAEIDAFIRYMWIRTWELFNNPRCWAQTCKVAERLIRERSLTFREVEQIANSVDVQCPEPEADRLQPWYHESRGTGNRSQLFQTLIRRSLRARPTDTPGSTKTAETKPAVAKKKKAGRIRLVRKEK